MLFQKSIVATILIVTVSFFSVACTTANYGLAPTSVDAKKDTFMFKIFSGGFTGGDTADAAVKKDIERYQQANGFKSHKTLGRRYNMIPSYFEYTVQFERN
jgi:hypothetical protein